MDLWDHWRKRGARIDVGQTIIGVSLKSNMIIVVIVTLELKCYFLVGERAESQPMCQTVQQIKIMCVRSCGSQIEAEELTKLMMAKASWSLSHALAAVLAVSRWWHMLKFCRSPSRIIFLVNFLFDWIFLVIVLKWIRYLGSGNLIANRRYNFTLQ